MEKIKLLIDSKQYSNKPDSKETACIKTRLANAETIKEVTLNELVECIGRGQTFIPAVLENGTKSENFKQQQLIGLDIDNEVEAEILTPEQAIDLLSDKGIKVCAYYHTFSSIEVKPKFRLLLVLKEASCNSEEVKFILEALIDLLPQADKCCKDVSRLFYGTNKEVTIVDPEARITLEDITKIAKPKAEAKTNSNVNSDLEQLINSYNLEKYMIQDGNEVSGSSGSSWTYFKTCKICGHKDCLRYYKNNNTFFCFGANGCKGGNIINYLMITKQLTYQEAVKYFKHELLEMKDPITEANASDLEIIKKQLNEISINSDFIKEVDWISYPVKKSKMATRTKNKEE